MSIARPDFGLEIRKSPKPKPVAMVTAVDILKEAVSLSISKHHDLTIKEKQDIHENAKLILASSPGHEANFYAKIVLKKLLEKQKEELENTLHVTQFLPSFLENSSETVESKPISKPLPSFLENSANITESKSILKPSRNSSINIRHSSPKKMAPAEKQE